MKEGDVLDKILIHIGDFGRHQAIAFSLICVAAIFNSATHMAYVFTAMDSEYRCVIPSCDSPKPEFQADWIQNAIPLRGNKLRKCEMYATVPNLHLYSGNNCTKDVFNRDEILKCDAYVFQDNENYIGREYNLLCEDKLFKLSLVGTINTVGTFFGLLITGIISDRHGRKIVLLLGLTSCGIAGILKSFAPTFEWFNILEFLEAVLAAGSYGSGFILGVELVVPKNRVWTSCVLFTCYAIGEVFIAAVAWAVKDWRMILYIIYGPCIFLIFFYWSIPESVRWYLSKGEIEKPRKILKKFADANGKSVPESYFYKLKRSVIERDETNETISFVEMLSSLPLFWRLINCSFLWITCALLFYGLTLNAVTLAGNNYLDFILISLIEIPAYWIVFVAVEKLGRKFSLCGAFLITSISTFLFILIEDSEILHLLIYGLGKFGATSAFILIYVITSEIFPTPLRHTTMGICSMIGRLGSMTSPQIPLLGLVWQHLPLILFALLAFLSAFLSLLLPETLNVKLPDTIREAERIGKKEDSPEPVILNLKV